MKALIILCALLAISLAKPTTLEESLHGLEATERIPDFMQNNNILEKKILVLRNTDKNDASEIAKLSADTSNVMPVSTPEERSHKGFKSPIIVKKKVGYHLYRDSDEEQENADPKEKCRKQVKVKFCEDESDKKSHSRPIGDDSFYETTDDHMTKDEMKQSIKMAKEAVEHLQRDLQLTESRSKTDTPAQNKRFQTDTDTELHKDIETARQVLEHIHNNFGNLQSMNFHAATLDDKELNNIDLENSRMAQWKETINNIQKNIDTGKNIEDRFKTDANNNGDVEIIKDLQEEVEKNGESSTPNNGEGSADTTSIKSQLRKTENDRFELQNEETTSKHIKDNSEISIAQDINTKSKLHSDSLIIEQGSNTTPQAQEQKLLSNSANLLTNTEHKDETKSTKETEHTNNMNFNAKTAEILTPMKLDETYHESLQTKIFDEVNTPKIRNSDDINVVLKRENNSDFNNPTNELDNKQVSRTIINDIPNQVDQMSNTETILNNNDLSFHTTNLQEHNSGMKEKSNIEVNNEKQTRSESVSKLKDSLSNVSTPKESHDENISNQPMLNRFAQDSTDHVNTETLQKLQAVSKKTLYTPLGEDHTAMLSRKPTNTLIVKDTSNSQFQTDENKENPMDQRYITEPLNTRLAHGNDMTMQMKQTNTAEIKDHHRAKQNSFNDHPLNMEITGKAMTSGRMDESFQQQLNEHSDTRWAQESRLGTSISHMNQDMAQSGMYSHDSMVNSNHASGFDMSRVHKTNDRQSLANEHKNMNRAHENEELIPQNSFMMNPSHNTFHREKIIDSDSIVQASEHADMREAMERSAADYSHQWFNGYGMSRMANQEQPNMSTIPSGTGAVGLFPNANTGGCAIPLLLSCSPSVVSGTLAKGHSSYNAPSFRSMDAYRYHKKRETNNHNAKLVIKGNPTIMLKANVEPAVHNI